MGETSLREYCEQIENTIEQGRFAEAVAHSKHILKQYPRYVDAYRLLGKAMLESGQDEYAIDMFRRVLSVNPEDMIAWVGLSEVHNKHDELDAAVWCLERAFELAADNQAIEEELRRLYSRRDGVELQKTPLTTGALARLYLKGDLFSRAINDLRTLLAEHPERVDLRVTLAEALWRNDQRLEASGICQQVLDELPYCLKTNLILGNIWVSSGREEGQGYLRRAEALDPENEMARELFGDASPLPAQQVQIAPLEYSPSTGEERPAWMGDLSSPAGEETALLDGTASLEAQIEIPSWLEEITIDEETPISALPDLVESPEAQPLEETAPAPAEEIPAWLATDAPEEPMEEQPLPVTETIDETVVEAEEETPEWLIGLGIESIDDEEQEDETPEWLTELGIDAAEGAPAAPMEEREEEYPEGLAELRVEADREATEPPVSTVEQAPDWLSGLRDQFEGEAPTPARVISPVKESIFPEAPKAEESAAEMDAPAQAEIPDWLQELGPLEAAAPEEPVTEMDAPIPAEIPDWLQELGPPEAAAPEAAPAPPVEETPAVEETAAPAWMDQAEVSGDEALAWLEQLAAGKEDELQAQIKAESEIRMAEIMGRPAPPEEAPPEEPVAEAAAPIPAEIPDWLQELGPPEAAAPEAAPAPPAEAPTVEETAAPAWMDQAEVSGDEALAWLEQLAAGKEDELQAQIKAESEIRMAEIMGRPAPPEEAPPEEPVAEAAAPIPAEIPDWLQELGPPEAAAPEAAPAPPVEETPAVEETAAPAWMDQAEVSGDEALDWLEQLAAGKEDELQAQIKAESEIRMAEIMGRPTPPEEAPPEAAPAPPVEETPAVEETAAPAWMDQAEVSGDEALAWLEQLAAGKEDELQAQIKAESEIRMAEIMGRPAPPEEAPPEEPVAEAAAPIPAEIPDWLQELGPPEAAAPEAAPAPPAEAPTVEETAAPAWMDQAEVSGDEALAWLEQLAAGKEDELQAQIKAESEIRMAEIMGRPAPPEEAPPEEPVAEAAAPIPAEIPDWLQELGPPEAAAPEAAPAPPVEETPAVEETAAPAWMDQAEVSGDEALDWLEQLAAGKEDELQAQIKAESEIRMAEIMGRPAPPEEAAPVPPAEAPTEEPVPAGVSEEALAAQVEEAFGWTAFGEPETYPEPIPPAEKAPQAEAPMMEKVTPPPEIAAPEVVPEETMVAPSPAEEMFGWTAFGEPEVRPEPAPPVEEALPIEETPPDEIAPPPMVEMPEPPGMVIPPSEEIALPPVIEETPDVVEMKVTEHVEGVAAEPETRTVEVSTESFKAERAYLKGNSRDYDAWLSFARTLWQANEREESLEAYSRVIRAGKLIENVIPDLEGYVKQWPDAHTQQVLGDAYMKDGQLQKALDLYRQALETL